MDFSNVPALQRDQIILKVTWTNCPEDVREEIGRMWSEQGLGNDYYYVEWDFDDEDQFPITAKYLRDQGITEDDNVLVHYWW